MLPYINREQYGGTLSQRVTAVVPRRYAYLNVLVQVKKGRRAVDMCLGSYVEVPKFYSSRYEEWASIVVGEELASV
jgi:hypothetical protein